jgi:hypothetical protein
MAEEYDLSSALQNVSKTSVDEKNKRSTRIKWGISGVLAIAVVGVFLGGTQNWFAKNNFDKPIALSENITRWTSISWGTENDFKGDLENKFGTWKFNDQTGNFTNEELGCNLLFTKLRGDYGDFNNDALDTERYEKKIIEGQEKTALTSQVFLPVIDHPEGGVEVYKTYYKGADEKFNVSYYRHSPENETIFLGVATCDTEESLYEVSPKESTGSEIEELGFWLKD